MASGCGGPFRRGVPCGSVDRRTHRLCGDECRRHARIARGVSGRVAASAATVSVRAGEYGRGIRVAGADGPPVHRTFADRAEQRSEEHTSELQSLAYLVCRLLLEKKKKKATAHSTVRITPR